MAEKVFIFDVAKCNGCYCCQIACKDEHVANDWSPIAKTQPDTGHFWFKITEHIRGTVPKVKVHYMANLCMHCDDAPCLKSCPIQGVIYNRKDGLVIIDPEKCTGCKNCKDACPYGAIYFNEDLNIAQKCTGCAHLLDQGWKEPRCVDVCPTLALQFGDESNFKDLISKAEVMKPEKNTGARVYYLNIPKRFIGGLVYNPIKKEIIKGAICTLIDTSDKNIRYTTKTDGFGDFWFEGLEVSKFILTIEAENMVTKKLDSINTERDVNLGEIPLENK